MRKFGTVLLVWLIGTWATFAQVQPGNQPRQPGQTPYPAQPGQGQYIQPVGGVQPATGQPGTGQPGTGQPGTGQPGTGQPKLQIPQPVIGEGAVQLPKLEPLDPRNPLDAVLMRWEQEMMKVQTLAAQLERTETDLAFKSERVLVGYAQYMRVPGDKPVNKAMLEMRPKGKEDKELAEKFICTGTHFYQYRVEAKVIQATRMEGAGQGGPDNFLSFLFGMRAQEVKRRYDLKLEREDQYYYYINVLPRLPEDRGDFERAQVVLHKDTFLPRMLWFQQGKDTTTTWQIPAIKGGIQVNPAAFDAPTAPAGWKLVDVPPQNQSRIIRGGQ
jgi:TIGR03009 family protein